MDARDQQGEDSKSTDRGKRKMDGEDVQKSQENPSQRPCPSTNQPMASQFPNIGCSHFYFHRIEIPADKIESGECTPGTYRRVHLGGTKSRFSQQSHVWVNEKCPDRRVNPIPHRYLPEPSSYGYINRPGLRPESQAAGSYPAHSSYYGDSSTQSSLWGPMPSPSGRHAAPSPGSLSIHPSNLGNHPIQPAAQYQANPSGKHPAVPWPGSLWNHPIQPAAQYQANPSAMPPAPWPGSDLPSSSSANYGYQANPSTTPATSQSGTCPAPLEYYTPHVVYHDPISPGFSYQANETVIRPASQPGAYPIPLFDTTNNPPTHATTQSQTTTSGLPSESSQEIIPAPQLHHNNPIQPEAGDEAYSSAMHASTSRKRQRK